MIRALCNHRFIPGNGIIGSGTFFIFKRNSERMEELEISRSRGAIFKHVEKENFSIRIVFLV